MRRMIGYQWLLIAAAVMPMAGCSGASSPDFADAVETAETADPIDEPVALRSPAEGETIADLGAIPERSKATPLIEPVEDEDVRIADADTPAGGDQPPGERSTDGAIAASQSPQPKERSDRDDPKARTIISQAAEKQDDAPLDNGRPAARPLPEGKRVAVKSDDVASEPLSDGRAKGAQPGHQVADPKKSNPTTKPAPPVPATLADVSDSLRALDKDGDGQVGLYEWPRDQLARFKTLDSNDDGFLTPAELVVDEKNVAAPSKAAAPKTVPQKTDKKAKQDDPKQVKADVTNSAKDASPESDTKKNGRGTSPAKAATKTDEAEKTPESETSDQADAEDDKTAEEDGAPAQDKPTQGS